MRIAMVGTRGVPARYGGFETAVEEIGARLVDRGHEVTVYCRRDNQNEGDGPRCRGMRLVHLPAVRSKALETLSHTALSTLHVALKSRFDAVFLFNAANSVFLPIFRLRRIPVAVHVDGLEWQRSKWGGVGKTYYRNAEVLSVRWADALIADADGISSYYVSEFGATTRILSYGAPILRDAEGDRLEELEIEPKRFHLVVARFEPENHVELIVRGYVKSKAELPLVVVGGAPYSDDYSSRIHAAASGDSRVRFLGSLWDQEQLDQLYANALLYLHGHSVGGTNPSLLRAMGAGAAVAAFDVNFNREVLGENADYFADDSSVTEAVEAAEAAAADRISRGEALRDRAEQRYSWDDVATGYEELARDLSRGQTRRGEVSGRRNPEPFGR